jgi:hypothetical protein
MMIGVESVFGASEHRKDIDAWEPLAAERSDSRVQKEIEKIRLNKCARSTPIAIKLDDRSWIVIAALVIHPRQP